MHRACVIVPVKRFALAKTRLARRLGPQERRALVSAMTHDVLHALLAQDRTWSVAVVTGEATIAARAESLGAAVLPEPAGGQSLPAAVAGATETLTRLGFARLAYVPSDVPLVETADVAALLGGDRDDGIRCVAADRDGSISAMSWPADGSVPIPFGAGGAARLAAHAREIPMPFVWLELPRLALDVDTPDDLARVLAAARGETGQLLRSWPRIA